MSLGRRCGRPPGPGVRGACRAVWRAGGRRRRRDRGAVAIFVALCAGALVVVIALVIDAGAKLRLIETTDGRAQEAARMAGQQLDEATLLRGEGYRVKREYVRQAADSYLALYGLSADLVDFRDGGETVVVTVHTRFRPALLAGLANVDVTGEGRATLVHGVKKAETD